MGTKSRTPSTLYDPMLLFDRPEVRGDTTAQIAHRLNVAPRQVTRWKSQGGRMREATFDHACVAYGLHPAECAKHWLADVELTLDGFE